MFELVNESITTHSLKSHPVERTYLLSLRDKIINNVPLEETDVDKVLNFSQQIFDVYRENVLDKRPWAESDHQFHFEIDVGDLRVGDMYLHSEDTSVNHIAHLIFLFPPNRSSIYFPAIDLDIDVVEDLAIAYPSFFTYRFIAASTADESLPFLRIAFAYNNGT